MDYFERIEQQEEIEQTYAVKHVDARIREEMLSNPDMVSKITDGAERLKNWMQGQYHDSKMRRMNQLKQLNMEILVREIFVGIAHILKPELFTSVVAKLAGRLGFDEKLDSITTMSEIIGVLCLTDAFDINKESQQASLKIVSRIPLSEQLLSYIENVQYLPPMLCEPKELRGNRDSGYLTFDDSLILGSGNHHEGNICLDVLNTMNRVPLKLDTEFLCKVEEDPNTAFTLENIYESALDNGEILSEHEAHERLNQQIENWKSFKKQSYEFYALIAKCGNTFHLTHKVDKRGRIYSQGFHLNTQGTSFKKASIEFALEETIVVPGQFKR